MSSRPWFPHSGSGSTQPPTRPSYRPPHLRRLPHNPVVEKISEKLYELKVTTPQEEEIENAYSETAVEATGTDIPAAVASFEEMGFCTTALGDNIRRCRYVRPTPIQRHAIPVAMAGRDLMACAQTGSGKTAAFCFPIISRILVDKPPKTANNYNKSHQRSALARPRALILAPTRELSSQIHDEAKKFSYQTGLKVAVAYGGAPIVPQLRILEKGVDILVATPGRLMDMIERENVSLQNVKYLALDEADRMLDMGFERQVRKIVQQMGMPQPGARQTMLFSATFPPQIQRLASDFLTNYIFITAGKVGSSTNLISQKVEFVSDMDKRDRLVNLLSSQDAPAKNSLILVFVETKRGADSLQDWLSRAGFLSTVIHGDKLQMERERALKSFRSGRAPILVATDVAARGLDIPHVAHVINFDLPRSVDDYVHRIGRTGRAGQSGLATAFFTKRNAPLAKALVELMQEANQEIPTWLDEYSKNSYGGGGSGRSSHYEGSEFGGHDYRNGSYGDYGNDDYSSQPADTAAYADLYPAANLPILNQSGGHVAYNFPYAANYPVPDPHASSSYGYGYNCGPVVASGWD
ncbi:hypothetical protein RD792_012079 [Penstemon davidsonii]|uniref:RNA helicase n=1 Tax=Penstemon davidsonii TaxID=160366 RepID=A0ABR0CVV7_9LAMI|nr:hypothetical protein RD792_012079 [Penstemon davidsonii]